MTAANREMPLTLFPTIYLFLYVLQGSITDLKLLPYKEINMNKNF